MATRRRGTQSFSLEKVIRMTEVPSRPPKSKAPPRPSTSHPVVAVVVLLAALLFIAVFAVLVSGLGAVMG
jgi:hypothetical protein